MDLGAAREHVRVARAIADLPLVDDALRRGQVSYSKVRALTRVATPATEAWGGRRLQAREPSAPRAHPHPTATACAAMRTISSMASSSAMIGRWARHR
jgi:hypothetical protein